MCQNGKLGHLMCQSGKLGHLTVIGRRSQRL